jgi:hypothetical protein
MHLLPAHEARGAQSERAHAVCQADPCFALSIETTVASPASRSNVFYGSTRWSARTNSGRAPPTWRTPVRPATDRCEQAHRRGAPLRGASPSMGRQDLTLRRAQWRRVARCGSPEATPLDASVLVAMRLALGLSVHTGWTAAVVTGGDWEKPVVVLRVGRPHRLGTRNPAFEEEARVPRALVLRCQHGLCALRRAPAAPIGAQHSLSGAGEVFVSDASKLYRHLSQKVARSVPTTKLEAWLRREGALT